MPEHNDALQHIRDGAQALRAGNKGGKARRRQHRRCYFEHVVSINDGRSRKKQGQTSKRKQCDIERAKQGVIIDGSRQRNPVQLLRHPHHHRDVRAGLHAV